MTATLETSSNEIIAHASSAPLPAAYESAKAAIVACSDLDECKDWADKAQALASYARQSNDDTLQKHAMRIQARAVRRCGELLSEFDGRGDHGNHKVADESERKAAEGLSLSRREVAEKVGLSGTQQKTAIRVANVPQKSFDRQVESAEPPTVTALAHQGKKTREPLVDLEGRSPGDFAAATTAIGELSDFANYCTDTNWSKAIRGASDRERGGMKRNVETIVASLEKLKESL